MYLLDSACHPLMEVFGWSTYLVGTAMQPRDGRPPRDIDVRTIVRDKQFDRLEKAIGKKGIAFLGIAIGQYLASLTGLPIDYQLQRMTEANALHSGTRNPLGHRNLDNYKGDATPEDARAKSSHILQPEPVKPPTSGLDAEFLRSVAANYRWAVVHHMRPAVFIAAQLPDTSVRTVQAWFRKARQVGVLPPTIQGRAAA